MDISEMTVQGKAPEKERRDWTIVLIILLFGLLCVIVAGGWAIRFAPTWRLNADMGTNIDPNSNFLTNRPNGFLEPLDPSILTQPVWLNVFLTPGASFQTSTPVTILQTKTPLATNTNTPTVVISPTFTATLPSPTNTAVYYPPPTSSNTKKPPQQTNTPTATNTPTPTNTLVPVDISITKDDGTATYVVGGSLTYTITVINNGTNGVTGAVVTDNIPAQITSWSWACTSQTGGANGCDAVANSGANFSDTVNLPNGASVVYTVTANISAVATGDLVNTATVNVPSGYSDTTPGNNSSTDTDTLFVPTADLLVTITDGDDFFSANKLIQYTIVVSNPVGPSGVTGATVSGTFDVSLLTNINWSCVPTGGAVCTANGSGGLSDSVDLPVGTFVTYTVNATVVGSPGGNLLTTSVTVTPPVGVTDPNLANNSAQDQDGLAPGQIGSNPDGNIYIVPSGTNLDIRLGTPLQVNGNPGWDMIYYEWPQPPGIWMDMVQLYVSVDGVTWLGPILNWGDTNSDTNTNISYALLAANTADCTTSEIDNCQIDAALLYNSSGVAIDVDGMVPNGTYYYLRIFSPPNPPDSGDGAEVDAIYIFP